MNSHLSCAIGIITYKRPDMVLECLQHLAVQTRLPDVIYIADASPDALETKKRIPELKIPIIFMDTEVGSTLQRNLILDKTQEDIILFLDDDSLLYKDYIENMMRIYEADTFQKVGGMDGIAFEGSQLSEPSNTKAVFNFRAKLHEAMEYLRIKYLGSFFPKEIFVPTYGVPENLKAFLQKVLTWQPRTSP